MKWSLCDLAAGCNSSLTEVLAVINEQARFESDVEDRLEAARKSVAELRMYHKRRSSAVGASRGGGGGGARANALGGPKSGEVGQRDTAHTDQVSERPRSK